VIGPELRADLEVPVGAFAHEEAVYRAALVRDDRATLAAPVGVADTMEVFQPAGALDQRDPVMLGTHGGASGDCE
jgi:hypothetical protein